MKRLTPSESAEYQRIFEEANKLIQMTTNPQVASSVLLKLLLAMLIASHGTEEAVKRLSDGVNECISDMKAKGIL